MFTTAQLKVIQYCAEECERQHSGEKSVYDMVNAWDSANLYREGYDGIVTLDLIEEIGSWVEPVENRKGFRTIPIGVQDSNLGWIEKSAWQDVPRLLTLLIESFNEGLLEPVHPEAKTRIDQFYYEFENIHPFRDGNGRTGKILYNFLANTLNDPIMPPNFWGIANP